MIIQPGTTLFGVWDETAGGWLCDEWESFLLDVAVLVEVMNRWVDDYGQANHTYSVRPFVVPAPGEEITQ